jgi:hypothetical protein
MVATPIFLDVVSATWALLRLLLNCSQTSKLLLIVILVLVVFLAGLAGMVSDAVFDAAAETTSRADENVMAVCGIVDLSRGTSWANTVVEVREFG